MKIKRGLTWKMFDDKWCMVCGKVTDMFPINTSLPCIFERGCPECGFYWRQNCLEDEDDLLECPDNFIIQPELIERKES